MQKIQLQHSYNINELKGSILMNCIIDKCIGHGGFGMVYQGIDTNLMKPVVVKFQANLELF